MLRFRVSEERKMEKKLNNRKDYKEKPDYGRCVAIVASASLWEMIKPGALGIVSPISVGFLFRILGYYTGHPLLGAKVVAALLMFVTVSGILMALFLNTAGKGPGITQRSTLRQWLSEAKGVSVIKRQLQEIR